jgi:hypothetical protein
MIVRPGSHLPAMVAPPEGTTLSSRSVRNGNNLIASFITAARYRKDSNCYELYGGGHGRGCGIRARCIYLSNCVR